MYATVFKDIQVYVWVCKGVKEYDNKYIVLPMLTNCAKYHKNLKSEEAKVVFTQYPLVFPQACQNGERRKYHYICKKEKKVSQKPTALQDL